MENYFGKYKKYLQEDPHQGAQGLSTRVGGAPLPRVRPLPRGPPGDLLTYPQILYLHFRGEKKSRRRNYCVSRDGAAAKP